MKITKYDALPTIAKEMISREKWERDHYTGYIEEKDGENILTIRPKFSKIILDKAKNEYESKIAILKKQISVNEKAIEKQGKIISNLSKSLKKSNEKYTELKQIADFTYDPANDYGFSFEKGYKKK